MLLWIENKQGRCPISGTYNPPRWRLSVTGYAVGAIVASLVYVTWLGFVFIPEAPQTGLGSRLLLAGFFWVAGGFAPTLLVVIVPWSFAVFAYRKLQWSGQLYFPGVGALMVFVLGCTIASLSPKPLFIEDQTFLEGALISAEREGIAFLLAGLAFGACYWFFGERQLPAQEQTPD